MGIPLKVALLCANCDMVVDGEPCEVCGSRQVLSLASILNRPATSAELADKYCDWMLGNLQNNQEGQK